MKRVLHDTKEIVDIPPGGRLIRYRGHIVVVRPPMKPVINTVAGATPAHRKKRPGGYDKHANQRARKASHK